MTAPAAASWYLGTINSAKIQTNLTDPINGGSLASWGDANSATSVTLSTVSVDFASSCSVTFTLPVQRRVLIFVMASFTLGTTTNGAYLVQPAYSSGSSVNLSSMTKIGSSARQNNTAGVAGGIWAVSATTASSVVLAQGTYTAFGACRRLAGGSASDLGGPFEVIVLDCGPS